MPAAVCLFTVATAEFSTRVLMANAVPQLGDVLSFQAAVVRSGVMTAVVVQLPARAATVDPALMATAAGVAHVYPTAPQTRSAALPTDVVVGAALDRARSPNSA